MSNKITQKDILSFPPKQDMVNSEPMKDEKITNNHNMEIISTSKNNMKSNNKNNHTKKELSNSTIHEDNSSANQVIECKLEKSDNISNSNEDTDIISNPKINTSTIKSIDDSLNLNMDEKSVKEDNYNQREKELKNNRQNILDSKRKNTEMKTEENLEKIKNIKHNKSIRNIKKLIINNFIYTDYLFRHGINIKYNSSNIYNDIKNGINLPVNLFNVIKVEGEGNNYYKCLAEFLFSKTNLYEDLRKAVVTCCKQNLEKINRFKDKLEIRNGIFINKKHYHKRYY